MEFCALKRTTPGRSIGRTTTYSYILQLSINQGRRRGRCIQRDMYRVPFNIRFFHSACDLVRNTSEIHWTGSVIKFESDRRKVWNTCKTYRFHLVSENFDFSIVRPWFVQNFAIVQQALSLIGEAHGAGVQDCRRCILFALCFCWKLLSPPGAKVVSWMSRWLNTTRWCALSETSVTRLSTSASISVSPVLPGFRNIFTMSTAPFLSRFPLLPSRNMRLWIIYQPKHYC